MNRFFSFATFIAGSAMLTACETATTTGAPPATEAPIAEAASAPVNTQRGLSSDIPAGKARIVVYRGSSWGLVPNLMKPMVKLDGVETAQCDLGHVIVRDVAPGSHEVSMQTDIVSKAAVNLTSGQTAYFKCLVLPFGLIVNAPKVDLVPAETVPVDVASLPRR